MMQLHVTIEGFNRLEYDKKGVRKALRQEAGGVRKIARSLLGDRGTSAPGEFPGLRTGLLRRSIRSHALRGEMAVVVEASRSVLQKVRTPDDAGYPWMLLAGSKRYPKRSDPVQEALERRREAATHALQGALQEALIAR
jgi:hypothetical protein